MRMLPVETNGTFFPHPAPPVTRTTTTQVFATLPTTTVKAPTSVLGGPQIGPGGTALPQPAWPTTAAPTVPVAQFPTQTTPPPTVKAPLIMAPSGTQEPGPGGAQTGTVAGGGVTGFVPPGTVRPGFFGQIQQDFGPGGFTIPGTTETFPWWVLLLIVLGVIFVAREA